MDRGDYSPCGTPTGLDARDPFDLQLGGLHFFNLSKILSLHCAIFFHILMSIFYLLLKHLLISFFDDSQN